MGDKVDFSYSFVRGSSTVAAFKDIAKPPRTQPITTILRLEFSSTEGDAPFASSSSNGPGSIVVASESGKALIEFVTAIEEASELDFVLWACPEEDSAGTVYLFIASVWKRYPPLEFSTLSALESIPSSSALSACKAHLISPLQLSNVPFNPPLGRMGYRGPIRPMELLTWTIPAQIDPTVYPAQGEALEQLRHIFSIVHTFKGGMGPRDLVSVRRGWKVYCPITYQPSLKEPSEKTLVFLFVWRTREAERLHKDPLERTFIWGSETSDRWELEGSYWETTFLTIQNELEQHGMKSQSLHLQFYTDLRRAE